MIELKESNFISLTEEIKSFIVGSSTGDCYYDCRKVYEKDRKIIGVWICY